MSQTAFDDLKERLSRVHDLTKIGSLLSWDQSTMMPAGGAAVRGEELATIETIAHEMFVSDEIGSLLDSLDGWAAAQPADSDDAALIRFTRWQWERERRVPVELTAEMARAGAAGYNAWISARAENDFAAFLPYLEKNIELKKRLVECYPEAAEPYDALFEDFEPGMGAARVRTMFASLKEGLVPLVKLVSERQDRVDDSPLRGNFPADKQKELSLAVIRNWGFTDEKWRLDPTHHPFADSQATTDIRITTRYDEGYLGTSFFGTLHETGHGLYEFGVNPAYERTPLCRGTSLGIHESQSRMWENLVGRSRPFWTFAAPIAREIFPDQLGWYDADELYRASNQMRPSLIRVEADEATYNLHIMIRFELETGIFEGTIPVKDLREAWDAKYKEYLGLDVPTDSDGIMQDVHWSDGLLGYFPCYSIGNVVAAQFWEKILEDIPDIYDQFAAGQFDSLRAWLVEHVHRYGRKYRPNEIIRMATGSDLDTGPYLRYITNKVHELYGPA